MVKTHRSGMRGAAHNGLHDWYWQRLSAVILLLLLPLAGVLLAAVYSGGLSQQDLFSLLDQPFVRLLHTLLLLAVLVHAFTGVKTIIEDYVHLAGWRITLVAMLMLILLLLGLWVISMIWGLA